jgi:hypothetical protein
MSCVVKLLEEYKYSSASFYHTGIDSWVLTAIKLLSVEGGRKHSNGVRESSGAKGHGIKEAT